MRGRAEQEDADDHAVLQVRCRPQIQAKHHLQQVLQLDRDVRAGSADRSLPVRPPVPQELPGGQERLPALLEARLRGDQAGVGGAQGAALEE